MSVAIIGLPGGCEPRHEKLNDLKKTRNYRFLWNIRKKYNFI